MHSLILLLPLLTAAAPDASPPDAWPLARGTASGCGVAGGTLPEKLTLDWTFSTEKHGFPAGAVIDGGKVYVASTDGVVYALELSTGHELWKYRGTASYRTTPAVRDGRVFLGDQEGEFACLDAASGKLLWKFTTDGAVDSPANFYRDRVLFGSEDSTEYCLDAASGKVVWKYDMEAQIRCLATIGGGAPAGNPRNGSPGRGYFAGCSANLYVLDLDKGTLVSKISIGGPTGCAAALAGDRVYVGTEDSTFMAIDLVKESIAWKFQDTDRPMPFRSSAAVTEEGVYVGSRDKNLYDFDPHTGRRLWEFTARGIIDSSPVVVGGRVYFGSQDGRIYGLDRKTGKEVWRYDAGGKIYASPAVAAGRLVIGSDPGKLYCFK